MRTTSKVVGALCGVALLLGAVPANAHHSMIVEFALDKPITLRGTLTRVDWTNPHGFIYLDVKRADGQVESWKVETGSPLRMKRRGLKKEDFCPGSEIIVGAYKSRTGVHRAAGMIVTFVDRDGTEAEASFSLGR
jgi:hypothetical protein